MATVGLEDTLAVLRGAWGRCVSGACFELFEKVLMAHDASLHDRLDVLLGALADAHALVVALALVGSIAMFCFVASLVTGNYSWVDRLWSITPVVYVWYFFMRNPNNVRLLVMSTLAMVWGLRLTYNFARKGGYKSGSEDYRWDALREIITNPFLWQLFNLGFIAFYQNVLLFMISGLPAYVASSASAGNLLPSQAVEAAVKNFPSAAFGYTDVAATALFLIFLAGETVADEQQWQFQVRIPFLAGRARTGLARAGTASCAPLP